MNKKYVLAINPGSTSTKISVFENKKRLFEHKINHSTEELEKFEHISEQKEYRLKLILHNILENDFKLEDFRAVVGRGGLLRSMSGGTYTVTPSMIKDLEIGIQGEHASNLGGILAKEIGDMESIPSFIVDPVAVDEFDDIARISGIPQIARKSLVHALNIKAVLHRYADENNKTVDQCNVIVAHLGGGISVSPLRKGKIIDANNASEMGPFSPERTGELPVGDIVKMCFSGKYTQREMSKKVKGSGGLSGYLGTNDAREVGERAKNEDKKAKLIFDAMSYQIGKEIGKCATVLKGDVEAIILTGGLAYSNMLTSYVQDMVEFIADVVIYPGEDEMEALNLGVLRILNKEEKPKIYEDEVDLEL